MTSQKDQIQALIAEIDSVLQKTNSRLPWVMSGEIAQQRQVLERVRNYLVVLQQQLPIAGLGQGEANVSPVGYPPEFYPSGISMPGRPAVEAQQMMQTILQEMSYLRASIMQPMQADLESLRQRRELLTKELSHLEAERQNQTVAQSPNPQQFTDELVQVLMSRLQESLSQHVGQALGNLQAQTLSSGTHSISSEPLSSALANAQYEQLQALRSRSDQMLVNLDSTLNIVFESLQRNIHAYQASLTQGLERMYSVGQQSEVAFKALISGLAQQLNQEASSYLHELAQGQAAIEPEAASPVLRESFNPALEPISESTANPSIAPAPSPDLSHPGIEGLATDLSTTDLFEKGAAEEKSLPSMPELDAALESWLQSTDNSNFDVTGLSSSPLDLDVLSINPAATQPEVGFPALSDVAIADSKGLTSDLAVADEDTAESDDVFSLLEDFSSELDDSLAATTLPDADAQIDQMLSLVQAPATDPSLEQSLSAIENSAVEQDEFYQSLFGDSATPQAETEVNDPSLGEASTITQNEIAPLSDLSNDFPPATSAKAADLDNLDQIATLANLTFESFSNDLELPELFLAATEPETTSITELSASLFDDVSITAPSLDPFPLTAETESLLTDLEPGSLEPDSLGSLTDLFQDFSLESAQSTPTAPPAIDWSSRQDAASMPSTSSSAPSDALTSGLPDSEFALEGGEDQFTRAALDENLLPDALHEVGNVSLDLDDFTLSSLSEDLFNVETSTAWQSDLIADDVPPLDEFSLFLEDSQETVQPTEQPLEQSFSDRAELTIEEFGTLFDDAPSPDLPLSSPSVVSSSLPNFSLQETQSPAEPLSTSTAQAPPLQVADDGSLPFTLEGMDDLFGDAPTIAPVTLPPAPQSVLSDSSLSSLGMQNLLGDYPSPPSPGAESLPFTLEGMDDLFNDAPSVEVRSSSTSRLPAKEILPFQPTYRQQTTPESSPFQLEELDNLLIETSSVPPTSLAGRTPVGGVESRETSGDSLSASPPANPNAPFNGGVDNVGLDEAFESLLGKSTPLQPSTPSEQAKEKKKAL